MSYNVVKKTTESATHDLMSWNWVESMGTLVTTLVPMFIFTSHNVTYLPFPSQ